MLSSVCAGSTAFIWPVWIEPSALKWAAAICRSSTGADAVPVGLRKPKIAPCVAKIAPVSARLTVSSRLKTMLAESTCRAAR